MIDKLTNNINILAAKSFDLCAVRDCDNAWKYKYKFSKDIQPWRFCATCLYRSDTSNMAPNHCRLVINAVRKMEAEPND